MDIQKSVNFIEKAITRTKSGSLAWARLKEFETDWKRWGTSGTSSFAACISEDVYIYLLDYKGSISMSIDPGHGLAAQSFPNNDDVQSAVIRLYNIVYSKFPNIDSILDEFINSD